MRVLEASLEQALGGYLVHRVKGVCLSKGQRLDEAGLAALRAQGITRVWVAMPEQDEIPENTAAKALAEQVAGTGVRVSQAHTGRVNFFATASGVLEVHQQRIEAFNHVHESLGLSTLAPWARVEAGTMVATLKIMPFALPGAVLEAALKTLPAPALVGHPFVARTVGLVQTILPDSSSARLDKIHRITEQRIASCTMTLIESQRCAHTQAVLTEQLRTMRPCDLLLIAGAAAVVDRTDTIPAAIEAAGGAVLHWGMPVDPGNLLLLARRGEQSIIALPGCAASPALNGFDYVLERWAAGLEVDSTTIMGMGVGGLLKDTTARALPRIAAQIAAQISAQPHAATEAPDTIAPDTIAPDTIAPNTIAPDTIARDTIAIVVLAAGASRRFGSQDKLLAEYRGKPLGRWALEGACAVAKTVVLVTADRRRHTPLSEGLPVEVVENPAPDLGMSRSLKTGVAALPSSTSAVMVLPGDMPAVTASTLQALKREALQTMPAGQPFILAPHHHGQRGHPVVFSHHFFSEIMALEGDTGARELLQRYEASVQTLVVEDEGCLVDIDTPQDLDPSL